VVAVMEELAVPDKWDTEEANKPLSFFWLFFIVFGFSIV
jgi:hypothetical protein